MPASHAWPPRQSLQPSGQGYPLIITKLLSICSYYKVLTRTKKSKILMMGIEPDSTYSGNWTTHNT